METAPLAGDGAWRERAQQLERDFQLLQEDTRALSRAFEGAAADLAFQQECQDVMVDKLAEIRLRRLHEFLRAPESAKTLFMEEAKPSARRDHPTMPRRELRALLAERWEALTKDELDAWEARFRVYSSHQGGEQPAVSGKKKAAPKLSVKTATPSQRKGATADSTAATPKKRKTASSSAGATPPSPSPSTPSKKRAKASKADAPSDASKALEDLSAGVSDSGTPTSSSKVSKSSRSSKPSPRKKPAAAASSQPKASPSPRSGKAASASKARPAASKTKKASKEAPAKKAPAAAKKTKKAVLADLDDKNEEVKLARGGEDDADDYQRKHTVVRDYSASDDDDDDDDDNDDDEDENESLSGGSPSDDDSDDNMAQLPTGAFG